MARWSTVLSGVFLALSMVLSLGKLLMLAAGTGSNGELTEADQWLTEIGLAQYRPLFKKQGISTLASCGEVNALPELPAQDEERLQRAARLLQQRLVLRQWLMDHGLHNYYQKLMQMEVMSLEDVYWVEDNAARAALGKDLPRWTEARQSLPTSKEDLETLKADLWSAVVKNSQHQDAWTWGMSPYSYSTFFPFPQNKILSPQPEFIFNKNRMIIVSSFAFEKLSGGIRKFDIVPEKEENRYLQEKKENSRVRTLDIVFCKNENKII